MGRVHLVLLAVALVLALAGCGGDGGGDNEDQLALENYFAQISEIAVPVGELGELLRAIDFGDDAAGSYTEELKELQQRAEDVTPPQALGDAHESFVEGLSGLVDNAELVDAAIQSGDEDSLDSAKTAVKESLQSILDTLFAIRQALHATPTPTP